MIVLPVVPHPLPTVPCPTYDGRRVNWEPWGAGLHVLCPKLDQTCEACGDPGPSATSIGATQPHPGETIRRAVKVGTQPSGRPLWKGRDMPAHPYLRLTAFLCRACHHLDVLDHHPDDGAMAMAPAEMVLCDGCDVACGVGIDLAEARTNLVALGGWTAPAADWDLCPACNPERAADPPPRALLAFRAGSDRP